MDRTEPLALADIVVRVKELLKTVRPVEAKKWVRDNAFPGDTATLMSSARLVDRVRFGLEPEAPERFSDFLERSRREKGGVVRGVD